MITADQVKDQASPTIQEVLRYSAGVRAEPYGIDNRGDYPVLRGGSEGATLLNGLRLPLSGYWGTVRNEPYAFERIEVLRGPSSLIAGQNGPGGVFNLVSKRPQAEVQREVGLQFGSFDHKQLNADLTGPLNADGSVLYRLVALAKDSGTQVDHAFDKRSYLAPTLAWRPDAATSFTLFTEYQKDRSGNLNAFFPYQGTILPSPNGPIPISTFIGEPDWDTYGGERWRIGWQFERKLGSDWTLRHSLRHDRVDGKMRTMYANWFEGFFDASGTSDPNGTWLNRTWYFYDTQDRITNADLLLEGKLDTGSAKHTLLFGVDGLSTRSTVKQWAGSATPLDVYNPVYGTFPLPLLPDVAATITHVRRVGVLLQDQIKFDERWVLVAGLRRDQASVGAEGSPEQKDSATTKNLGLVWLADGGWSPYASYSESFDPVAGTDASGTVFKPTRGKQLEAGVKWQPVNQRVTASAAVYQLKDKNRLATDPVNVGFSVQRGEVTAKGLELEATASLPAWDLTAQYTFTDAQVSSTTADDARYLGKQLGSIPRHSAAAWAAYKFGALGLPGWKVGLGLRYVGRTNNEVGTQPVPATTLADALIAYDAEAWRLALNVNNLADKIYVATCLERGDCWFGTRRRAVLSATYRW